MYPFRLSGNRLFVPNFGILPYIRGLRFKVSGGGVCFQAAHKKEVWSYWSYSGDHEQALMSALRKLEEMGGALHTCKSLRKTESKGKKNPTGYVGVYKVASAFNPYRVTCPYETDEVTDGLLVAAIVREQAVEEYVRKNTFSLSQLLSTKVEPILEMAA